jgi:cell division septal protein FtsQ
LIFVFIGVFIGVVAIVIGMVVYCLAVRKRKRLKVSGTKQVKAEI